MDLEFISFSDPNEIKSKDAQRRVRSHAMQHVRRRQRLGNQRSPAFRTLQPKALPDHSNRISPENITWYNSELGQDEEIRGVDTSDEDIAGSNRMEQLEVYPVSPTERYIFTIFHYCECFRSPTKSCKVSAERALVPLPFDDSLVTLKLDGAAVAGGLLPLGKFVPTNPLRTRVLSLVTQDTALFHTILAQGGMDMMTWRGEPFFDPLTRSAARGRELGTVFCLKHKTEAIRIINERINDPILCTSDETILAVSHLAGYEVGIPTPLDSFRRFLIAAEDVGLRNESKRPLA